MHRESVYVCTLTGEGDERVGYVRAWDDREAAELFARELELESDGEPVRVAEIRVRPAFRREGAGGAVAG
jgi:hypothetical protein